MISRERACTQKKTVTEVTVVWWSIAGSNRWPPACKAGALPAELMPQINALFWHATAVCLVGLNGLEPTTSPLSGVRSNHLSYRPNRLSAHRFVSRLIILTQENTFANTFLKISSKFFKQSFQKLLWLLQWTNKSFILKVITNILYI